MEVPTRNVKLTAKRHRSKVYHNEEEIAPQDLSVGYYTTASKASRCGLAQQEPLVSPMRVVRPAGGRCLPKDLAQLIAFAEGQGYPPRLLQAIGQVNHQFLKHSDGTLKNDQPSHESYLEEFPQRIVSTNALNGQRQ